MPPSPYRIDYSGDVNEQFRRLIAQARDEGREEVVRAEARRLFADLMTDPFEVGEARNNYPAIGIRERFAVYGPLVAYFGVHEASRVVIISRFRLLKARRG